MKPKINWAIPALFAMILIIVAIATAQSLSEVSTAPDKLATQCGTCHGMDEQVQTWQHSAHKDVSCTSCHTDPGAKGWFTAKVDRVAMWFSAKTTEIDPSQIATKVPSERCVACHARQMPWVMQDLKPAKLDTQGDPIRVSKNQLTFLPAIAGHDTHLTGPNKLECVDCHSGTSHGASDRPGKAEEWHNICLSCHADRNVSIPVRNSVACSACHIDEGNVTPPDHNTADFRDNHGQSAKQAGATCQQCHLNSSLFSKSAQATQSAQPAVAATPAPDATAAPTAAGFPHTPQFPPGALTVGPNVTDACSSCHGTTMPHPADFLKQHGQGFLDKPEVCANCHGTQGQGFNTTYSGNPRALSTTDKTCTTCHQQAMPHPADWLGGGHQAAGQNAPQTCEQCHSSKNPANPTATYASPQYCLDCHLNGFSHGANYVSKHANDLAKYGGDTQAAGCIQCHTTTTNSCTKCHVGGVSANQQWHPADWTVSHRTTMAQFQNNPAAAGCTTCHSTSSGGNNSCTECHSNTSTFKQNWHPADWISSHKGSLASYNGSPTAAGCTQCHSLTDKSAPITACVVCHTSGVGSKQQWHPSGWFVTHARTTTPDNEAACMTCHNYVQPACSKCHPNR